MKAILFDLDGTLLPLDFDTFLPRYTGLIHKRLAGAFPGVDLIGTLMNATQFMMRNDGSQTNQERFWSVFGPCFTRPRVEVEALFDAFYRDELPALGATIQHDPAAVALVASCRSAGLEVVLATNPIFPRRAVDVRLRWAGVEAEQFDLVTTYETMHHCKPHPGYYREIATALGLAPGECLVVGNDTAMDLAPAQKAGMRTCLAQTGFEVLSAPGFVPDHTCALGAVLEAVAR